MARYIDADLLKQQDFQDYSKTDVECAIDNCPTADVVEVKHGKWAYKLDCNGYGCYECSCCNTLHEYDTDYCPNCGAKMDGERRDT